MASLLRRNRSVVGAALGLLYAEGGSGVTIGFHSDKSSMTSHGKTIRIYLADGTPTGIRHAELVNWIGQALVCPRARISELAAWEEAQRPGVYFLFGEDEAESRPTVYVGHAENVLSRLRNHVANKDFWSRVVVFTSKDKNLTKAHVKYLEARIVELAGLAGRTRLENGNAPQLPALPRSDRDAMEEFLGPLRVLLGALGFPILQTIASKDETERPTNGAPLTGLGGKRLYFSMAKRNINAEGAVTDEGFVVFEGSVGDGEIRHHLTKGYRAYREQLTEDGSIRRDDGSIRLMRDVLFTSPSAAAEVLSGGAYNGREAWKDENGATLKSLEDALAVSSRDD